MASKVVPDVSDDVELYKIEHQDDIESPMFVELTPMKDAVPYGRISPIDIITAKEKKSAQVVPYNGDNVKFYQVTQQDENENDSPIPMDSTPEDEAKNERISPIGFASEITPPRKEKKKPKIVSISVKIYSISDINCIEVTFQVSIKLFLRWEDPKLIGHKVGRVKPGIEPGEYEIPGLFNPDIQIANEFELHETSRDLRVIDSKTGKVKLSVSYRGKLFMMEMGLKYFPFDAQNLQIILKPHKLDETNVILKYSPDESASDFHPVHEWRFVGFCAKHYRTDPNTSTVGKIYSSLHVVICVQRESGWFVNNILIPTFILTMVSWATFGLYPTGEYAVRMDSAVGTILATVANKFVVADSLPKVPYRSLVDIYLDVSFLCQVIAVFATILVSMYATPYNYVHEIEEVEAPVTHHDDDHFVEDEHHRKELWTDHLNLYFFLLDAAIYVLFHTWYLWLLYQHKQDVKRWESGITEAAEKSMEDSMSPKAVSIKGTSSKQRNTAIAAKKKDESGVASRRYLHFAVNGHMPVPDNHHDHHE